MLNGSDIRSSDAVSPMAAFLYLRRETTHLRRFDDHIKMELLFLILLNEKNEDWYISRYVNALSTSPQSDSRMNQFIRALVNEGSLRTVSGTKQTAKHLALSGGLRKELGTYLNLFCGEEIRHLTAEEEAALLFAFKVDEMRRANRNPEYDETSNSNS